MKLNKRILTIILIATIIMSYICVPVQAIEQVTITDQEIIASSELAESVYNNKNLLPYEKYISSKCIIGEGLTIIYGYDIEIDVKSIFESSKPEFETSTKSNMIESTNEVCVENASYTNTYMVIILKQGDRVDFEYVSITYESDVSVNVINKFISAELTEKSVESRALSFMSKQVKDKSSALNYYSTRSSYSTDLVQTIVDTNYYIANYRPITGGSYPVMVYRKNIKYYAIIVENTYQNEDLYFIISDVQFTTGRGISSSVAEGYLSNGTELYNDEYDERIAIDATRTIFENLNPTKDYYIQMSPNANMTDIAGQTLTMSLGSSPSISKNFTIPDERLTSTLYLNTTFNSRGQCKVEFEARGAVLGDNLCLTTFGYSAGVYMSSGGYTLSTRVATDLRYYFMLTGIDPIWTGSAREFYYVNTESSGYN